LPVDEEEHERRRVRDGDLDDDVNPSRSQMVFVFRGCCAVTLGVTWSLELELEEWRKFWESEFEDV
jgi:hypothetical protein